MTDLPRYIRKSIKDPERRDRYQSWLTHQLGENRYMVWEDLEQIGLKKGFEKLIVFKEGKRNLRAWRNLFEIKENVYRELVAEFMVTFQFDQTIDKLNDDRMIRFNFMGNPHHMSLATFAKHLDLYTEYQVTTPFFLKANTEVKQRDHTAIWQELTGNQFQSNVKATSFLDKHHQVLHNLLACSIRGKRKTKGAVGVKDLRIIKSIVEQEHVNVAYLVADRILTESCYDESEFAYMGSVITKLVSRMGLLTEDVIGNLTPVAKRASKPYDLSYMVKVWLLDKDAERQIR